jgi:hypothetical protein
MLHFWTPYRARPQFTLNGEYAYVLVDGIVYRTGPGRAVNFVLGVGTTHNTYQFSHRTVTR